MNGNQSNGPDLESAKEELKRIAEKLEKLEKDFKEKYKPYENIDWKKVESLEYNIRMCEQDLNNMDITDKYEKSSLIEIIFDPFGKKRARREKEKCLNEYKTKLAQIPVDTARRLKNEYYSRRKVLNDEMEKYSDRVYFLETGHHRPSPW